MRIAIDISQIVYQTGVSRYTSQLVEHLLKIDDKNQYLLYAGSLRQKSIVDQFVSRLSGPVQLVLNSISPKLADMAFNRLNLNIDNFIGQVDVFHSSNWALPRTRARLVTTIHDLSFLKYPQTHSPYSVAVHTRHLNRAKKYADHIIAVSQSTKDDLIEYGIKKENISVIYEAAASVFKPTALDSIKTKYNLSDNYFLTVGTLEPRKNLKRLIEAFSRFLTTSKNCCPQLVIVGPSGWGEALKPAVNVKFLGFVPDKDLVKLYSGAKAFIYPSLYEGFGLPVLEALSCGCPVITSDLSSLPEVAGDAAVYINPKSTNEITKAMKSIQTMNLKAKALAQARRFSWQKTARETLSVYQEVIK